MQLPTFDLYVMGASVHSYHGSVINEHTGGNAELRGWNPGAGLGAMYGPVGLVAGAYHDSIGYTARYCMLAARYEAGRWCADLAAGYFDGSVFDGLGGVYSLGLRVYKGVWIHASYYPPIAADYSIGTLYMRIRL